MDEAVDHCDSMAVRLSFDLRDQSLSIFQNGIAGWADFESQCVVTGFHIIQVTAKEENRRLSPEARLKWQELALQEWVNERRETSEIEITALK